MEKEFALVLSGGGTRGAYQVGVWKALQDLGIKVKAITGTSIGSLNGALILQGDTDGMIDIYKNLKMEDFIIVENQIDAGKDLFDKKNIKAVAKEYLNKKVRIICKDQQIIEGIIHKIFQYLFLSICKYGAIVLFNINFNF